MDIFGHSQIAVTMMNTCGHVIPAMQQEAAGQMDAMLGDQDDSDATDDDRPTRLLSSLLSETDLKIGKRTTDVYTP